MTDLAESLIERGVDVTAICGRGLYNGGERLPARGEYKGAKIIRAWSTSFGKTSLFGRLIDYVTFYIGAFIALLKVEPHDIVMPLTTPPLINLVAVVAGRGRGMRVVSLVQDVYPDVAIRLGALHANHPLTSALDKLNRYALNASHRIIVLGECMSEKIAAKLNENNSHKNNPPIDVIHNWADGASLSNVVSKENAFTRKHELAGKFVVAFSGNFGHVNDFETVLESARLLRERGDIVFVFTGAGAKTADMTAFVERHNLSNVRFLPYQPRETLIDSLAAADVHLVTLAHGLAGLSVPSKTYGIIAVGKPVLFVGDEQSAAARLVVAHDCGAVIKSGACEQLAGTIIDWAANPDEVRRRGARARAAFISHFDRQRAVDAYMTSFAACLNEQAETTRSDETMIGYAADADTPDAQMARASFVLRK